MANGEDSRKGRILYEEKKIGSRLILIVFLLSILGPFAFYMMLSNSWGGISGFDVAMGLFLLFILLIMMLPIFYARRHPIVIYEKGFDAPVSIMKFSEARDRFVPYSEIDRIHPEVADVSGRIVPRGFTVITKDGRRIEIFEIMESKVRDIKKKLAAALGDAWNRVYVDAPYVGFDELQKIESILSRSRLGIYLEAVGVAAFAIALSFVCMVVLQDFTLVLVSTVVLIIGTMFAAMRIQYYRSSLAKCKRAVRADPTLEGMLRSMGVRVKYENPVEKAKRYTAADWRRLHDEVNSLRPYIVMATGFVITMVAVSLVFVSDIIDVPFVLFLFLLFLGLGVVMSSMIFVRRMSEAWDFVKVLIEEELKRGTRILPDWFELRSRFGGPGILREPPRYTDEEWEKIVSASRIMDEKHRALLMVVFLLGTFVPIVLIIVLDLPFAVFVAVFSFTMAIIFYCSYTTGRWAWVLQSIEEYEAQSGQKVIPERYRSRIVKGWTKVSEDER